MWADFETKAVALPFFDQQLLFFGHIELTAACINCRLDTRCLHPTDDDLYLPGIFAIKNEKGQNIFVGIDFHDGFDWNVSFVQRQRCPIEFSAQPEIATYIAVFH